jgi:hypothetical protein
VAENVIPVAFIGEDVARVGEVFFELFDVGGHLHSLAEIEDRGKRIADLFSVFVSS